MILAIVLYAQIKFTAAPVAKWDPISTCQSVEPFDKKRWWRVKNCKLEDGHTLDELMNAIAEQNNDRNMCGEWGQWIHDKDGEIIGQFRNPPCPVKK